MPSLGFRIRRRTVAGAAAAAVLTTTALAAQPALAAPAQPADNSSTLTVVGTSDVFDSGLVDNVIKPDFQARYPGVTLNYVSLGTGAAIAYAEAGSASALLVHAPSLENQFVAAHYSDNDQPGRAFFWGDYVLLGPSSDPAAVARKNQHNVAGAFAAIAAAGAQGRDNFVSRGGTPGTTVQEHQIWALTTGVTTCTLSSTNGGGAVPSTTSGPCPSNPTYPSWYHTTGLTQGPNLVNADTCNYSGGNCYVFTDSGTFQYLNGNGTIHNLHIVTQNNSAKAPGGVPLLVNSFHGYAVNPNTVPSGSQLNEPAAQAFLSFVTSPTEQINIGNYLKGSASVGPFRPDAAPTVTVSGLPTSTVGRKPAVVTGTLTNVVPGTPPLAGKPVTLTATDGFGATHTISTVNTDSTGNFTFRFNLTYSARYAVSVPQLTQVEYPDLSPPFSDVLAPTSASAGSNTVTGAPTIKRGTAKNGMLTVTGSVAPPPTDANGSVTLSASADGGNTFTQVGQVALAAGQTTYSVTGPLSSGTYTYRVAYEDDPYVNIGFSPTRTIKIP